MKKNLILAVTALVLLLSFQMVWAEESYFGADIVKFNDHGINVQGVYGMNITEMIPISFPLALEARIGASVADDDNLKVDYYAGAYLRPEYVTNQFRPYALLGVTYAKTSYEFNIPTAPIRRTFHRSNTEPDLSYGLGLKYDFGNGLALSVEYLLQLVEDVDGVAVGIRKYF